MRAGIMKGNFTFLLMAVASACLLMGCDRAPEPPKVAHKHEHKSPHGGTRVVLGNEEYHLEFVLDAAAGKMDAYVLDGELENFVRVAADSFEITAQTPGGEQVLSFKALANSATGEKIGDTSEFEAQAAWLKNVNTFDAVLKQISIHGTRYDSVKFNFPNGNDTD